MCDNEIFTINHFNKFIINPKESLDVGHPGGRGHGRADAEGHPQL